MLTIEKNEIVGETSSNILDATRTPRTNGPRIREEPIRACARAHPWDLESSGLCRERTEELGRLAREVGESVPEVPPFFLLAAAERERRSFLPSSFTRALAAPELPGATETDGRRCVYY